MNGVEWHLLLNHFPIVGTIFTAGFFAAGVIFRQFTLIQAALISYIVIALIAIPVYFTGEQAEAIVEERPGINPELIKAHEEHGVNAFILVEITGLAALIALLAGIEKKEKTGMIGMIAFIISLLAIVFAVMAGSSGGKISHPELRQERII
ncbi:MAG: hypothetical protein ACOCZW_02880, partial [Bacteroidota bacterium]